MSTQLDEFRSSIQLPPNAINFYVDRPLIGRPGTIRYFGRDLKPFTLTEGTPYRVGYGAFHYGCVVEKNAIVEYVGSKGKRRAVFIFEDRVTSIVVANDKFDAAVNPTTCWEMRNGIPQCEFVPEVEVKLSAFDLYFLLQEEAGLLDEKLLEPLEWKQLMDTRRQLETILKAVAKAHDAAASIPSYADMKKTVDHLITKYRLNLKRI